MRRITSIILILLLTFSCSKKVEDKKEESTTITDEKRPLAEMSFEEESYDFGTIDQGETVTHSFKFKNTGKEPLVIQEAKPSCGCTVPELPEGPILPGRSAEINVKYRSKNSSGKVNKSVTILANVEGGQKKIFITGTVNKK